MIEQILPDCSMRACSANTELYLIKKTMCTPEILTGTLKLERIPGGEIRVGPLSTNWVHRDGEENLDYPDYLWIVARRIA